MKKNRKNRFNIPTHTRRLGDFISSIIYGDGDPPLNESDLKLRDLVNDIAAQVNSGNNSRAITPAPKVQRELEQALKDVEALFSDAHGNFGEGLLQDLRQGVSTRENSTWQKATPRIRTAIEALSTFQLYFSLHTGAALNRSLDIEEWERVKHEHFKSPSGRKMQDFYDGVAQEYLDKVNTVSSAVALLEGILDAGNRALEIRTEIRRLE